jgi:hypothetical protein
MTPSRRFATHATLWGLLLWPLAAISPSHANDSAFSGVGGTPKPLRGEHRSIVMQSEKVSIVANDATYDTVVDFIFRNDGRATSVQMGFPESSYGDVSADKKSTFLSFATYVDGRKVAARRIVTNGGEGMGGTDAFWLKTVTFAPRQTRRIRVAYRSPMGGSVEWGIHKALNYPFTGQNGKGKVERSDLEIRVSKPGLWIASPSFGYKPLAMTQETTPQATIFRKTWRNWQAQGEFTFGLTPTVPFWMMDRAISKEEVVLHATTFRVGPVPQELPNNAEAPHGFMRDNVTYISLSHLQRRLDGFSYSLEKYRNLKVKTSLGWNEKSRSATLRAGAKTLTFSPNTPVTPGGPRPILLPGTYGNTLFVPLAKVSRDLGLEFSIDSSKRLFDLRRGNWTGQ